jgi:hypothetical protein
MQITHANQPPESLFERTYSTYTLPRRVYVTLSGLSRLLYPSQHRALPRAGVLVPFRAGKVQNLVVCKKRFTSKILITPALKGWHPIAMGIAHRLKGY